MNNNDSNFTMCYSCGKEVRPGIPDEECGNCCRWLCEECDENGNKRSIEETGYCINCDRESD